MSRGGQYRVERLRPGVYTVTFALKGFGRQWEKMKSLGMTHVYIEVPGGAHMTVVTHDRANMMKIFDFFDHSRR